MVRLKEVSLGEQLIFVVSQPRSGSTLLQHILGSHSEIYTVPEPWFMLPLVYGLRERGLSAEYNALYACAALRGFLQEIGGGEDQYWGAVRAAALQLYQTALDGTGKSFFLDKTPRYYFILRELRRIFPKARFILLVRNPVAVFASILNVNFHGDLRGFLAADRRHDIFTAPRVMADAIHMPMERTAVVYYEALATRPDATIEKLCEQISINYEPSMLNYGGKVRLKGSFVDPKSVYEHSEPVDDYVASWPKSLDRPEKVQSARAYLKLLGEEVVAALGYSYHEIHDVLNRLPGPGHTFGIPWDRLLAYERPSRRDRFALWLLSTVGYRMARKIRHYYRRSMVQSPGY